MLRDAGKLVCATLVLVLAGAGASSVQAQDDWIKRAMGKRDKQPAAQRRTGDVNPYAARNIVISPGTLANIDRALQRYERLAQSPGWPSLPKGRALKVGDGGDRVKILIRRLVATGDLDARALRSKRASFDKTVEAAVKRFQFRNGLTPSGRVNSYTRSALNVTAEHRRDQLIQNRQRLAELLQQTQGRRYVFVNIPAYELQAVNGGRLEIYSRVVLGKPSTPTPAISAKIKALNTLPYWHVPQSIAQRQLIPAIKKDPNYLAKQRIRVFASWGGEEIDPRAVNWWAPQGQRFVFRQEPGPTMRSVC